VFPERTGHLDRIDTGLLPPGGFIADAMHQPMVDAADRDREFVAGLAAERPRLQVAEMKRVGGLAAADQARLLGDMAQVLPVAVASRAATARTLLSMPLAGCRSSRSVGGVS
jgi:hypothetical protein